MTIMSLTTTETMTLKPQIGGFVTFFLLKFARHFSTRRQKTVQGSRNKSPSEKHSADKEGSEDLASNDRNRDSVTETGSGSGSVDCVRTESEFETLAIPNKDLFH